MKLERAHHSRLNTVNSYKPTPLAYNIIRVGLDIARPLTLHRNLQSQVSPNSSFFQDALPNRVVLSHALLASKDYWGPFIRGLHQAFTNSRTSVDLFIVDLRHHNDTAHILQHTYSDDIGSTGNYMVDIALDIDTFIRHNVLSVTTSSPDALNIGLVGHSLGARALLLRDLFHATPRSQLDLFEHVDPSQQDIPSSGRFPMVSLDASATHYDHTHFPIIRSMIAAAELSTETESPMRSRSSLQQFLKQHEPGALDDNTIAFVLNNNLYTDAMTSHLRWKTNVQTIAQVESHVHFWPVRRVDVGEPVDLSIPSPDDDRQSGSPIWNVQPSSPWNQQGNHEKHHVLFIGGQDSTRLTVPRYIHDTQLFFPGAPIKMIRGGHFAHQGVDLSMCAQYVADHFQTQWSM